MATCPTKSSVAGEWPMAMNTPSVFTSVSAPVLTFFSRTCVTVGGFCGAEDLVDGAVPDHLDLGVREQAVLQDALGAETVAAVHDRDLGGEVGEVERFLDRGVAAADDHDLLVAEKEAVARGACRHAEALEASSLGSPSQRACAPVAMISASQV